MTSRVGKLWDPSLLFGLPSFQREEVDLSQASACTPRTKRSATGGKGPVILQIAESCFHHKDTFDVVEYRGLGTS